MPRTFHSKQDRYKLERILAAAFVTDKIGYNFKLSQILLKSHNFQIDITFYTNTMSSIVRNVYRKIEEFVNNKNSMCSFPPLSLNDFKLLRTPLLQVREWFYQDELQTYFQFFKIAYNLSGGKTITIQSASRLYGQIRLALQKQRKADIGHLKQISCVSARKRNVVCKSYRTFAKCFNSHS